MELFTKEIIETAKAQYPLGSDLEKQLIVAKFFNPCGMGTWYLMNIDPEDEDYCWGIVDLFEVEMGSFSRSELENAKVGFGLSIERDLYFETVCAKEIWEKLIERCASLNHITFIIGAMGRFGTRFTIREGC